MTKFRNLASVCALLLSLLLAAPSILFAGAVAAQEATPVASGSGQGPVLLFAAPGMRPYLVETFAAEGVLPEMAGLLDEGLVPTTGCAGPTRPRPAPAWRRC